MIGAKLSFRAASELLGLFISAISLIYISRIVGPYYLGISATASAVIALISKFADGGLTSLASQMLARDDKDIRFLMTMTVPAKIVASILLISATILTVNLLRIDSTLTYFINISIFLILFDVCVPTWVFISKGMINVASIVRIGQSIGYAILAFAFIRTPDDWRYLPYLVLGSTIINFSLATGFMLYLKLFSFDMAALRNKYFSNLRQFYIQSFHYLKADLSVYIYSSSDRLVLYYFTTPYVVGIYEAAYKIINPFYSISTVVTPTMYRNLAQSFKKGESHAVLRKYVFLMSFMTIPLGFFLLLFSKPLILAIYGPGFADSIPCLKILGFVITFGFIAGVVVIPFSAWNMAKEYGNSIFCGNIVNIILNIVLIPIIGAPGAALATLAAKISVLIVAYNYFKKVTSYPIIKQICQFILVSGLTLLFVLLLSLIIDIWFFQIILFIIIYTAGILFIFKLHTSTVER